MPMTSRDIDTLVLGPIEALTIRLGELEKRLDSLQIVGRPDTGSDIQVRFKEICSAAGHDPDQVLNGRGKPEKSTRNMACRKLSAEGWGVARIATLIGRDKRTLRNILQRSGQRNHGDLVKEAIINKRKNK